MTWNGKIEQVDTYRWRIPEEYKGESGRLHMRTSGLIFADEEMMEQVRNDNALEQVANVTTLPGIVGSSMAMPDIHWGYGFPIGGVAATDGDQGVISPGGVGFDINCGVRLVRTNLSAEGIKDKVHELVDSLFTNVPSGIGSSGKVRVSQKEVEKVLVMGARWAVENGYGWDKDLLHMEENGCMKEADHTQVSQKAKTRGMPQLGSLGAGNHFLEIQAVDEIFEPKAAKAMGIEHEDQIVIMIHTGSRGLGYQVCSDHLRTMEEAVRRYDIELPDKQLACAPVDSPEARAYFGAMASAANYAWTNRQMIMHWVRESFKQVLGQSPEELEMDLVYDVAHNIAKKEEHLVEGQRRKLVVHRKGATRAFGPDHSDIPTDHKDHGQPVLIPGDMGTASYLLAGTQQAMEESFGSTCHGAGRVMSRKQATRMFQGDGVIKELGQKNIYVRAQSKRVVAEEAPQAYKDV
ncbi:MAG: RtcB family protein, partial [Thermoplasmata archaeon]|nr:RtcB family protein [Thermoplasmata archaeon]